MGLFCIKKITSRYSPSLLEALGNKSNLKPTRKITFGHFKMRFHVFKLSLYSGGKKNPVLHIYPLQTKLLMCVYRKIIQSTIKFLELTAQQFFRWVWIKILHIDMPSASCNQWCMTFTAYYMGLWELECSLAPEIIKVYEIIQPCPSQNSAVTNTANWPRMNYKFYHLVIRKNTFTYSSLMEQVGHVFVHVLI